MTLWVGSTPGTYDKGQARVKSMSGSSIVIGESSDIAWSASGSSLDYLTIVDDYFLWAKRMAFDGTLWSIEGVPYYNQYSVCDPVPVLGPQVCVLKLTGATVVFHPTAADSWVVGSSIAGYAWTAPGSLSIANSGSASPTITYNAPGVYRYSCTVTAANGQTNVGHRLVYVWDETHLPIDQFNLDSCSGQREGGGWTFQVTMYDQSSASLVRNRALCVLFSEDYYGSSGSSIGPLAGYENVWAEGWIDGESINTNPEQTKVQFTVEGPAGWLQKIADYPASLTDPALMSSAETSMPTEDWIWMPQMTVDAAIWHLVHWRSTVDMVIDVYKTGDTRHATACSAQMDSLWAQMTQFSGITILASPECNRFGQLIMDIDCQYLAVADRTNIPVVMDLTKADWEYVESMGGGLELTRITSPVTGMTDADGYFWNSTTNQYEALIARSGGFGLRQFGAMKTKSSLFFADQAQANSIAGLLQAKDNNEYPKIAFTLAQNNRFFDIAPCQYFTLTVAAGDTQSRVSFTAKRFIPRVVSYKWDNSEQGGGMLTVSIEAEAEVFPENAIAAPMPLNPFVNGIAPYKPPHNTPPPIIFPGIAPLPPPGFVPGVPPTPPPSDACPTDSPATGPFSLAMQGEFYDYGPQSVMYGAASVSMYIRTAAHTNKTRVAITGTFEQISNPGECGEGTWIPYLSNDFFNFQALDQYGQVLGSVTWDAVTDAGSGTRWGTLNLGAVAKASMFRLIGTSGSAIYAIEGAPINHGIIPVTAESGIQLLDNSDKNTVDPFGWALNPGDEFAVESAQNTGPWYQSIIPYPPRYDIEVGQVVPSIRILTVNGNPSGWTVKTPSSIGGFVRPYLGDPYSGLNWVKWDLDVMAPAGSRVNIFPVGSDYGLGPTLGPGDGLYTSVFINGDPTTGTDLNTNWSTGSTPIILPYDTYSICAQGNQAAGTGIIYFEIVALPIYNFGHGDCEDDAVVAPRTRIYFKAEADVALGDWVRVNDTVGDFANNSGSLGFTLYKAKVLGDKRIRVTDVTISNVCGAPP
jgi:hypothetical protein